LQDNQPVKLQLQANLGILEIKVLKASHLLQASRPSQGNQVAKLLWQVSLEILAIKALKGHHLLQVNQVSQVNQVLQASQATVVTKALELADPV